MGRVRSGVFASGLCLLACAFAGFAQAQFLPAPGLGGIFFGARPRAVPLEPQGSGGAWWNPAKQNAYMHQVCRRARSGIDKDECQYVAESLISNLTDCVRDGSPYARTCARLLPGARAQLARVNNDPTLQQHRQGQRRSQRNADIRALCAQENGGYHVGGYSSCTRSYGVEP